MSTASFDAFKAFAEAAEAMQVKPQLEAKIAELEAQLRTKDNENDHLAELLSDRQSKLIDTETKLSSLEVERDQYFFQATEAEDRLAKVAGLLGLVNPIEPVEAPSTSPEQQGNSIPFAATPETEPTASETVYLNDEPRFVGTYGTPISQFDSLPGVSVSSSPTLPAPSTEPPSTSAGTAEATASASEDGGTSINEVREFAASSGITSKGFTSALPYIGKPRWHKPASLDLNEWLNGGGE